jgi:hypothetical protein
VAGTGAPIFQSRPAGIELELDAASKALGLTLGATSITQDSGSSLHYTEWLGELYNGSEDTQCLIQISGDFQTDSGVAIIKFDTFAQGAAYDLGSSDLASPCAAPGETVPLWSNALPEMQLKLETVTKLVVTITPLPRPNADLHPSTPTITPLMQTYSDTFDAWQIATTATATADIYNVAVTFWGKSGAFFVDNQGDYHLENFIKASTWAIDTAPLGLETATLSKVVPYFDFIDGLKSAARRVYDAETSTTLAVRRDAFANREATRARRERARTARHD